MPTKTKRSAGSSRRERLTVMTEEDMRAYAKSPEAKEASRRLRARGLEPTPEDLKEIAPLSEEELARMYHPAKQSVTTRLDPDIVSWLRSKPGRYQTNLNLELRKAMERELRKRARTG